MSHASAARRLPRHAQDRRDGALADVSVCGVAAPPGGRSSTPSPRAGAGPHVACRQPILSRSPPAYRTYTISGTIYCREKAARQTPTRCAAGPGGAVPITFLLGHPPICGHQSYERHTAHRQQITLTDRRLTYGFCPSATR